MEPDSWTAFRVLISCVLVPWSIQISWLTLRTLPDSAWTSPSSCEVLRLHGLTHRQASICRKSLEVMPHLVEASHVVVETCQTAFVDRRWNCSSLRTASGLTADLTKGTREQAFVYALSSASLAYYVSRACSAGRVFSCGCGSMPQEPPNGNFQWGGCADNVHYGIRFSKSFLDRGKRRKRRARRDHARSPDGEKLSVVLMNDHNNRAGRRILQLSLKLQCKCHGVSGSCSIQTCWYGLGSIQDISHRLKTKYAAAIEVKLKRAGGSLQLFRENSIMGKYSKDDLIYTRKSPDYCTRNEKYGSYGTEGRHCNATSPGHSSCISMCCGRGYITYTVRKRERCRCKYHWCCYVTCQECFVKKSVHVCL